MSGACHGLQEGYGVQKTNNAFWSATLEQYSVDISDTALT
jgi:hypothetical protein